MVQVSLFTEQKQAHRHGKQTYCYQMGNWGKGQISLRLTDTTIYNLYAEYIMRNAGLEEAQAGIKIAGRNINNLRYTDGTTLMAESAS